MDAQLKFFLQESPTSVKELSRLLNKSTSAIYKALKDEGVQSQDGPEGKLFFMLPDTAPEASVDGAGATSEAPTTPSPTETAAVAPVAPAEPGKRGRKPTGAGHKLTATVEANGRRKGSHGFNSLQIILDNPGITQEDYIAKGGRLNDLRWDIAHGSVKAECGAL